MRSAIETLSLIDGATPFEILRLNAEEPRRLVLFAVGAGGDPARHLPLLEALAGRGCTIVAPRFERLVSPIPTATQLLLRARRLRLALDAAPRQELPAIGVGHSVGAAMLLALAGARAWTFAGERLAIARDDRLARLALFAPATDFFQAPGSLDDVGATILAWAGSRDAITPPAQAERLREARRAQVELRVAEGAGHFSFMNAPPPHSSEPLADRDAFLARLAAEVCAFATA